MIMEELIKDLEKVSAILTQGNMRNKERYKAWLTVKSLITDIRDITLNANIKELLNRRIKEHRDSMLPEIPIGRPSTHLIIHDSNRDFELRESLSREREDFWFADALGIELDSEK